MAGATSPSSVRIQVLGACALALGVFATVVHAQKMAGSAPAAAPVQSDAPNDRLGRGTPRGTVMGFLSAARAGQHGVAAQYLNASGSGAEALARELFVVLDARLPARLPQISDAPEGSGAGGVRPNEELVGTIEGGRGTVEVVLERVQQTGTTPIWLFSARTLREVPALHDEIVSSRRQSPLRDFLAGIRVAGIRLGDFLAILFGLPLLYLATLGLERLLVPPIGVIWRRVFGGSETVSRNRLPTAARVLLVMLMGGWLITALPLSLAARQLWSNAAGILGIGAVAWLLVSLNGAIERHIQRRILPANSAAVSLLRLLRRCVDLVVLFAALIVMLRRRGIDPTPALAGLGVGGIAVALAAQKTLENVIAGASLIFDQAVRVGDFLKMGEVVGTVDHIGLRSTRIRTLDRTVVSVPNSQIANASVETLSSRDKFWFHPIVGLRYETTPEQLHSVIDGIRRLLDERAAVDPATRRVRFLRLGAFSLDVEVFTYLHARDWDHFLEIQEQLLFDITEIVNRAGTAIAFPSQTTYVETAAGGSGRSASSRPVAPAEAGDAANVAPAFRRMD